MYYPSVKVLVFGSREWLDQAPVERELAKLPSGSTVIHGACRGADNIAGFVAKKLGLVVREYPANWKKHGRKAAGPLRNQQMLDEEHRPDEPYDFALCFHKDPGLGVGSRDMKARCDAVGIRVDVHRR